MDKNNKIAQSTGRCARHGTEGCIVAKINTQVEIELPRSFRTVRRVQSQKPMYLHKIVEKFCPNAKKGELFGRHHNLRTGWTTIGKEVEPPARFWQVVPETDNTLFVKKHHREEKIIFPKEKVLKKSNIPSKKLSRSSLTTKIKR